MVTAKEIAPIWMHEHSSSKQQFIKNIIVNIYNEIPDNDKYRSAHIRLSSILDSLWYKAPEIINNSWHDIYKFLEDYLILDNDMSKKSRLDQKYNCYMGGR